MKLVVDFCPIHGNAYTPAVELAALVKGPITNTIHWKSFCLSDPYDTVNHRLFIFLNPQHNQGQHIVYNHPEQGIICGTEQRKKQMDITEEWPTTG